MTVEFMIMLIAIRPNFLGLIAAFFCLRRRLIVYGKRPVVDRWRGAVKLEIARIVFVFSQVQYYRVY